VGPPAVFRVTASGSRFWPAPVGDLDPDNVVRHLDRDRLAGGTRAAVPQTIGEKLAHQQGGHVRARMTGAKHPLYKRASQPRPLRPSRKRHALPNRPPSHQRTRLPGRPRPGKSRGPASGHMRMHARLGGKRQARDTPGTGTGTPSSGYPHRSLAPIPVRYASVDTATQRPTALQGDTRRDREETPRQHEISQLAGRFRSVWQVLGSNQRRLSRRFYSVPLLFASALRPQRPAIAGHPIEGCVAATHFPAPARWQERGQPRRGPARRRPCPGPAPLPRPR
jgi:hypothetical protein